MKAGQTSRDPHDVSHDAWHQAGARRAPGGRQRAQRPYFLFGSKEASAGEEYRGIRQRLPYWCNETKTGGRQSGGHHGAQDSVTTRAFGRRRPLLSG